MQNEEDDEHAAINLLTPCKNLEADSIVPETPDDGDLPEKHRSAASQLRKSTVQKSLSGTISGLANFPNFIGSSLFEVEALFWTS